MATEPRRSDRSEHAARWVGTRLGIDNSDDLRTLSDAYSVAFRYPAPLMVRIADDMLADLREDIGSRRTDRIVALGRDGHSLAYAMASLDRGFYKAHVSNIVLSRALMENALQDLENRHGRDFSDVHGYRRVASKVDPVDTIGGFQSLTNYLTSNGVPVGRAGSRVTLFDTSFKGTVQELLTAAYPETRFNGRYAFLGESPHDPHPGSKRGYEVHLSAAETRGGLPLKVLPADESKTFGHQLAINSIEEQLNGPMSSAVRIGADGPEQTGQRNEPGLTTGLSEGRISPRLRDPEVREGVKVINLMAVTDCAMHAAFLRDSGRDYRPYLESGAQRYRAEIRAWISGVETDPRLKEFLDSFVHRGDKHHVELLQRTLAKAKMSLSDSAPIWAAYDRCGSDDDKRVFVQNVLNSAPGVQGSARPDGGRDGWHTGRRGSSRRLDGPGGPGREL